MKTEQDNPKERRGFWTKEQERLLRRHENMLSWRKEQAAEIDRRRAEGLTILVKCMDERNTFLEEALDLFPGEPHVFASAGGELTPALFGEIFEQEVTEASTNEKPFRIYLMIHENPSDPELGCAAFSYDVRTQESNHKTLRGKLHLTYPTAFVHVLSLDTSTMRLRAVETDPRDRHAKELLSPERQLPESMRTVGHAGHGIYLGESYRAWVTENNTYFHLTPQNPDIKDDIMIALKIMAENSAVNLDSTPAILHVDYPKYANLGPTVAAKLKFDELLASFEDVSVLRKALADGSLRIFKTETEVETWQTEVLE